jgi:hypothetical protein
MTCVHCGRVCGDYAGGLASVERLPVCHPNDNNRPDCYHLITVYNHQLRDCRACYLLVQCDVCQDRPGPCRGCGGYGAGP